jgi:hypothetical protein
MCEALGSIPRRVRKVVREASLSRGLSRRMELPNRYPEKEHLSREERK